MNAPLCVCVSVSLVSFLVFALLLLELALPSYCKNVFSALLMEKPSRLLADQSDRKSTGKIDSIYPLKYVG